MFSFESRSKCTSSHIQKCTEDRISGFLLIDEILSVNSSFSIIYIRLSPLQSSIQDDVANALYDWILLSLPGKKSIDESARIGSDFVKIRKDLIGELIQTGTVNDRRIRF